MSGPELVRAALTADCAACHQKIDGGVDGGESRYRYCLACGVAFHHGCWVFLLAAGVFADDLDADHWEIGMLGSVGPL